MLASLTDPSMRFCPAIWRWDLLVRSLFRVVSASRWRTEPHIACCAAIPRREKHYCHHPTTVLSRSRSEWLWAVPYSENVPQGDAFRTTEDGWTPEDSKRSLPSVHPTMAGSMEQVCVRARVWLWRWLGKRCHISYHYSAIPQFRELCDCTSYIRWWVYLTSYYQRLNLGMQLVLLSRVDVRQAVRSYSDCIYSCASGRTLIRNPWLNPPPERLVNGLRAASFGVRFLSGAGDLPFCSKRWDSSRGPPVAISPDIRRSGHEADHSPPSSVEVNPLTPNDLYMSRTTPLTSKRCILYIYSTNIGTEYFKHALYSPFFFLFKMQFVS